MANLKNINFMSQDLFENIEQADDELYAVRASGIGFPSSRYEDLVLGASGTQYTAPANGYFAISKMTASLNQFFQFQNISKKFLLIFQPYSSGSGINFIFPVQKGDIVATQYTASGTTAYFRFIYAEGE